MIPTEIPGMTALQSRYNAAKRALFDKKYDFLTQRQREAVFTIDGPLLILAGAGSGKTTVLVNRIAYMVQYGNAYMDDSVPDDITEEDIRRLEDAVSLSHDEIGEILAEFVTHPCPPWAVLSITFTNKAAGEMKERLAQTIGDYAADIWAGTFHAICIRILHKYGDRAGYAPGFTIYDTEDQKKLLLQCLHELNIDDRLLPVRFVQNTIGRAKDRLLTPEGYAAEATEPKEKQVASVYTLYQKHLKEANALDFDDIILETVRLLEQETDIREYYQNRFRYVSVDEYQDTNYAQFRLVSLLSGKRRNLMVVGDDDQSIYKFRGATIENILHFDRQMEGARIIRLEQNFRSTQTILNAANAVIRNNLGRHGKELWTENKQGEKIVVKKLDNQNEEAKYIINKIMEMVIREKRKYSDFAVLYRINAQSNSLEQIFARSGVPYRMLGGMRYFERKEVKDILAYLCLINNPADNLRLRRIINEPKRKIGESTVKTLEEISSITGVSMFDIMEEADRYPALYKTSSKLKEFAAMIRQLRNESETLSVSKLIESTIDRTGYKMMLIAAGDEGAERLENVQEMISNAVTFEQNHIEEEHPTLSQFLEEIALTADIDNYDEHAEAVVLMTIHSAKGLEFPVVFMPGFEEGIFPGMQSSLDPEELEEERRLAYVAITRAKDRLFCSHVRERLLYGRTQYNQPSRFLAEIPQELIDSAETRRKEGVTTRPVKRKPVISEEFTKKAAIASSVGKSKSTERFAAGDVVDHITFGRGVILSATTIGSSDVLYEVAFDSCGTKKLMATYAKLKRAEN